MECEAISFNDVQDKSARQQLLWQCVQQSRGRAQRQHRQAVTLHAAATQGFAWGTCQPQSHWPDHCIVSTGDMFSWYQFCASQLTMGYTSHDWTHIPLKAIRETLFIGFFFVTHTGSLFNSNSLFEECTFTHYRVLHLQHNVLGICALFDPPLHRQIWA